MDNICVNEEILQNINAQEDEAILSQVTGGSATVMSMSTAAGLGVGAG